MKKQYETKTTEPQMVEEPTVVYETKPASPSKKRKSGIEEAMEDIQEGRVYKANSVEDLFKQILG